MTTTTMNQGIRERREQIARRQVVPSAVLGTLVAVGTEIMFFMALVSAYIVIKAGVGANWIPPSEVRLPVLTTAFNTFVLTLSGVALYMAGRLMKTRGPDKLTQRTFLAAILLATFFVGFQGYEWVQLIKAGMAINSGIFGACFFLLIGAHGLHAAAVILAMVWLFLRMKQGTLTQAHMTALQIFWAFIVGVWPILYGLVYF